MRLYRAELRKGEDLTGALKVLAFEHDGLWLWIVTAKQELSVPPEGRLNKQRFIWWKAINGRGDEIVQLAKTNWLR